MNGDLNELHVAPRGNVTNVYAWGCTEIDFYNGKKKKQRRRIHPSREISFVAAGTYELYEYLTMFYDEHHGCLGSFTFHYDGVDLLCHFSKKIEFTQIRERSTIVGFEAEVSLRVDTTTMPFTKMTQDKVEFDFVPRGKIKDTTDWNTNIIDMLAMEREQTWTSPIHTFSLELVGDKKERDRLIDFYTKYGDFTVVSFSNNHVKYQSYLPGSLTIVDHRELGNIIGFECSLDLVSFNGEISSLVLSKSMAFVIGQENRLTIPFHVGQVIGPRENKLDIRAFHQFICPNNKLSVDGHLYIIGEAKGS